MDIAAFYHDILQSRLYNSSVTDADEYAELFDEVKRVLDIHASLRTGRLRSGQHDNHQLSDKARRAKQLHRRWNGDIDGLVYSRTDRPTTQLACQILKSAPTPADRVRSDWNGAVVASVSPQLPVTVCQAWQPPVTSSQPQRRRPSRIRTGTHRVCRLLQSSGWRHSLALRTPYSKTVWSMYERIRGTYDDALYKSTYTLLYTLLCVQKCRASE